MAGNEANLPDVTGYRVDEAIELLESNGIDYYIKSTKRSDLLEAEGSEERPACVPQRYRVVKQVKKGANILELLLAMEAGYEKKRD